jgi:beta-phosphoglucomutase-like phosphatase (HAD superfamily)
MSDAAAPLREIDAVVFDMDGVLIDSEPYWREAEIEVFGSLGVELTPEMHEHTLGWRIADVVDHWHERFPWDEPERAAVVERLLDAVIDRVRTRGVIAPGAADAVALVERLGVRLAIASSSPYRLIEATLEVVGLAGRFEVVLSAQDLALGKPDPAVYLRAAEALAVAPERCLAIEDSPTGVRAAKAAGMVCIGVPTLASAVAVSDAGADVVVASLEDLDERVLAAAGVVPDAT